LVLSTDDSRYGGRERVTIEKGAAVLPALSAALFREAPR
jgi:hypothetical protein